MKRSHAAIILLILVLLVLFSRGQENAPPKKAPVAIETDTPNKTFVDTPILSAHVPEEAEEALRKRWPTLEASIKEQHGPGLTIERPYQVHWVDFPKTDEQRGERVPDGRGGEAFSIISQNSYWEYPILNAEHQVVHFVVVRPQKGAWKASLWAGGPEQAEFAAGTEKITDHLESTVVYDATQITRFRVEQLYMDFFYIETAQGDYLMPLFLTTPAKFRQAEQALDMVFIDVENKQVYPADSLLRTLLAWKATVSYVADNGRQLGTFLYDPPSYQ